MKSSLLGGPEPKNFHSETSGEADASMVPEMEIDEDDGEISEAVEATKPKQRLSFSNKVPEVKQVKKKEINQYYAFAGIILFSVGVLGYVLWNSEPEVQDFKGIETNSNMLSEMTEPKDGLQENNNTTGEAKSSVDQADGSNDASSEMLATNESGKEGNEYGDGFVDPYPQVLPDVPEESFDFANDKSSRELTREGYQALKQGKPDKAVKLFELALKKDPKFAEAVLGLGRAHQKRGELNLAKDAYCRHSDLPESSFAAKTMVEEVNISQGIVSQLGLNCDETL
jgi:tetratricopeptide (TPR) repeat protein